ncbi:CDP-alcohol phosphatidyltransferase family protein [Mangrovicella endophytica]|uniref:CDP-alcohol phosphatidyltransferase family protein n=1 Tax=Mangrovicella endophytica TaxID=2066697 RepID=UPI000C9E21AC|nr:CDP-alcohol phosphatidyltransferase family protein [Mangrovicella endophytica]
MTVPNFISIARLLGVPALVWALITGEWQIAFAVFVLCGVSDALDGAIARHFNQQSMLGRYLDPMADKALLVAVYLCLCILGHLPVWLATLVVSRDVLIVAAVLLSFVMDHPVTVRPLLVSKLTTAAQILLAGTTLAEPALHLDIPVLISTLIGAVTILTVLSAGAYLIDWLRHMAADEGREGHR